MRQENEWLRREMLYTSMKCRRKEMASNQHLDWPWWRLKACLRLHRLSCWRKNHRPDSNGIQKSTGELKGLIWPVDSPIDSSFSPLWPNGSAASAWTAITQLTNGQFSVIARHVQKGRWTLPKDRDDHKESPGLCVPAWSAGVADG